MSAKPLWGFRRGPALALIGSGRISLTPTMYWGSSHQGFPIILGNEIYAIVTTVPLAVGYGALNLSVRSLDR